MPLVAPCSWREEGVATRTEDWYTLAGVASLSHPDPTVLADEIWALRDLERAQEFFTLHEF